MQEGKRSQGQGPFPLFPPLDNQGNIVREVTAKPQFTPNDQAIANYLERVAGIRPTPNPFHGIPEFGRQADSVWDGLKTEFKTSKVGADAATIKNEVNKLYQKWWTG